MSNVGCAIVGTPRSQSTLPSMRIHLPGWNMRVKPRRFILNQISLNSRPSRVTSTSTGARLWLGGVVILEISPWISMWVARASKMEARRVALDRAVFTRDEQQQLGGVVDAALLQALDGFGPHAAKLLQREVGLPLEVERKSACFDVHY